MLEAVPAAATPRNKERNIAVLHGAHFVSEDTHTGSNTTMHADAGQLSHPRTARPVRGNAPDRFRPRDSLNLLNFRARKAA